jgi:hypothetical protein
MDKHEQQELLGIQDKASEIVTAIDKISKRTRSEVQKVDVWDV